MGKKNYTTLIVLAVLFAALFAVEAFALPDNPPTCSLSSNTGSTTSVAVLTAVSVDTLANAGVESIRIYEDGSLINTKSCGYATTCVSTKTVIHSSAGSHNYHAVCRDRAGQVTSSSTVRVTYAGMNRPPVINSFSPATPLTIDEDETRTLSISASDPDGDTPLSYEWKVDGATQSGATSDSFSFQRDVSGTSESFVVAAYVRDPSGAVDVQTWSITVRDLEPSVALSVLDATQTECDSFDFTATATSYDSITSYAWDFDDGTTTTTSSNTASHTYTEDGTYTVRVTVTDSDGDTATHTRTVVVSDITPVVDAGPDDTIEEGTLALFDGDASMPCASDSIQNYTWDFGDGSPVESGPSMDTASHNYTTDTGSPFTVTLTVCDEDSCASDTLQVVVEDAVPVPDFTWTPAAPNEGETVSFTDTSTSYDAIASWEWDFDGDGTADSTSQNPSASAPSDGDWDVCLLVTDVDGDHDAVCHTMVVGNETPVVDLFANVTLGGEPLDVEFNCSVAGGNAPYSYVLDFGDGSSTTSSYVVHTYATDGVYNATCIVTDDDGDLASDSELITVQNVSVVVDLDLNVTTGDEPLEIEVDCTATAGNPPFSYTVDFGDGTSVGTGAATHIYAQNGTYTVTCIAVDSGSDVGSATDSVVVLDTVPVVDFTWEPLSPDEAETVVFNATATAYDAPITYDWDFGDGSANSSLEDPSHAYAVGGDYTVTLTVTDNDGSSTTVSYTIHISDNPPSTTLVVAPMSGDEPLTVDADCSATGGDAPLTFVIDFGDGTVVANSHIMHVYAQNGTYTVTCNVSDADGDWDADSATVIVSDTVPTVDFTWTPADPLEGESVSFDSTWTAYDTPITFDWDFGDSTLNSALEDPSHVFANAGLYTVTLTVTDNDGSTASVSHVVNVSMNAADVMLVANTTMGYESLDVEFACAALDGNPPYTYVLDFGDGSAPGSSSTAVHTYAQDGTYTVICTVTDDDGDVSNDTVVIDVLDTEPVVSFTYFPAAPAEGENVSLDATISAYDMPYTLVWDFGDGSTSTTEDEMHIFALAGTYNVSMTVTDNDGSVVVVWQEVTVGANEPFVNLEASPLSGPEGLNVSFNCTVVGGNAPLSFSMDYGDGTSSTDQVSSHVYDNPGSYVAECIVTDGDGDYDFDTAIVNVANNAPNVTLTAVPTTGPEGVTVDFDCNITGGDAPFSVLLDFGDGSSTTSAIASHNYTDEGVYTATCTVTDADSDIGSDDLDITVTDNPPVVNLDVNQTSGFEPLSINYTCNVGGGNGPFTYVVDFGDSSPTSSLATGEHDYVTPGTYSITCTVTDVDSDSDDDTVGIHVLDNPPVVDLIAVPTVGPEGVNVSFTCDVTGGNAPFSYLLEYGDGAFVTSDTGWHVYPYEGDYNATCTVVDSDPVPDTGIDSAMITVDDNPPIVNLMANVTSGLEPLTVNFTCVIGGGNAPFAYLIDFGDGSAPVAASEAVYTYAMEGEFDATCDVVDFDGDTGSDLQHIEVLNNPPVVDLIATPSTGPEGVNVSFACNVVGGNAPLSYLLDFGDGTSTTESTGWRVYPYEGEYNASCTVTDSDPIPDVGSDWEIVNITDNPPVVNLMVNATSGLEPLSINYTCDVGGGNEPFTYVVDFGDGSPTSSLAVGEHDYALPGVYNLTCLVTDFDGDWNEDLVGIHVMDNPPVVDLVATPTTGPEGVNVSFTCDVTGGNAPFSYVLDFGDGTSTTSSTGWRVYPYEGEYNASCTVSDSDPIPDIGVDSELINITDNPPVVNLVVNTTSGLEELDVNYTCNVGGGNAPFTYIVDFGDSSPTSSNPVGAHTYVTPGTYVLTCTVVDFDTDSDWDDASITVIDNPPVVDLIAVPTMGLEGMTVDFNCSVTGGNAPLSYVIDFGDGSPTTSDHITNHTYPLEGDYNATCTVTDSDVIPDVGSDWESINVTNNVPVVNLVTNVTGGTEPLSVFFNCTLVGGGNAPFSYEIDFGDGSPHAFTETATHTYPQNYTPGYTASCTITDIDSDVSVPDTESIDVFDSEPHTNFTYSPSSPIEGDVISFTDQTTAYDGVVSWSWDFGDGNTSTAQNPTHAYMVQGPYIVVLTTTDGDGSQTSHMELITVGNNVPVVDVVVTPVNGTEPLTVSVACSVSSGGNAPFTYSVMYGDGAMNSSATSVHTYTQSGSYPVVCLVTDADSDVGSDTDVVTVEDTEPVADFSWTPALPVAGDLVSFTDLTVSYDTITSWAWDFNNDGVVESTLQNPNFTFPAPALYIVNLTVTDSDGSVDSTIRSIPVDISIAAPIIFSVSADDLTNVSANITWGTDQATDSLVEFGTTPALGSSVFDGAITFSHAMPLNGLTPNTTYYYNVTSCNLFAVCTTDGPYNFTTLATSVVPVDTVPPVVTMIAPADASTDNDGNVTVQYNVTDDMADPLTCDVYSNTSGAWAISAVQSVANATSSSLDFVGLSDGTYAWNVECSDGTNTAWAGTDWTFDVALPLPTCGDNVTDAGEQCDDGNLISGDGCSALCVNEYCGDSILQSLVEQCDDGGNVSGDGCSDVCAIETIPATCGDGVIDFGEECDSGNLNGFNCTGLDLFTGGSLACTASCTFDTTSCTGGAGPGVCGDGVINVGESCDGADWGPVSGCSDFGFWGGSLGCSSTCSFNTSACSSAPTGQTIIDSTIYGGFYPLNFTSDVTETTVTNTHMLNATVQGTPVSSIIDSNLTYAILTNVSPIQNCTVIGDPTNFSVLSDGPCVNVYIDPSNVIESNTTGSSVRDSNISYSTAVFSGIVDSEIQNSDFSYCTVERSYLDNVVGYMCTITDSVVSDSTVDNSTVQNGATVTNSTIVDGSTVSNSVVSDSTLDTSSVSGSTVDNSQLTDSTVSGSDVADSTVDSSTVTDSTVADSTLEGSTVTDSNVTGSDLDNSTVNDSTITDSTLIRSTVDNSTVINSTLVDMIVDDAWIEDGVIYNGTISDDVFYNATENGPANLTDVVNYPPVAVITASATVGTDSLAVDFSASASSDPNIPGPLNDSLSYSWDWDAADGIAADATGLNVSNTFGVGVRTVTLTVTDSFGRSATAVVDIQVSASSSGGGTTGGSSGGGGGGGGGSSRTFILVLTEAKPEVTLPLKTGDTVKYSYAGEDYSFVFRYVYSDKAKMGVAKATGYKEYTLDENKKYNLNLNEEAASDLAITPANMNLGKGDFTFELLGVEKRKPIVTLPVGSVDRRVVSADDANAELESEPEDVEPEEEDAFSEGVLDFVESLSMKSSAPLWAGIGLSLIIILVGLGLYWLVTRKEE